MEKVIKTTKEAVDKWTKAIYNSFISKFPDKAIIDEFIKDYILRIKQIDSTNTKCMPATVNGDNETYIILAYKDKGRMIITLTNPKTGAFGKAICCKEDMEKFSIEYGIALAYARLKKKKFFILADTVSIGQIEVNQHFILYNCEYVMVYKIFTDRTPRFYCLYNITNDKVQTLYCTPIKGKELQVKPI